MTDLVTFGETMLRLSPPDEERLETTDQYDVDVAGAESNVAVAAQRLGLDCAWLSKLPNSPVGRKVAGELRSHGLSVDVVWDDSPARRQGTYYLEQGRPPRGSDVIYDRAHASVTTATTVLDSLPSVENIYTSGRNGGSTGLHTGHTPYLHMQDWSGTMVVTTPSALTAKFYPAWKEWPYVKGSLNTRYVYAHPEFTPRQTMRFKTALYGCLYGLSSGNTGR